MCVPCINWLVNLIAIAVATTAWGAELEIQDPLAMRAELLKRVPREAAITQMIGDGRGELFVFVDPMDDASRRLVGALQGLPHATIHYYLAPNGVHDSVPLTQRIWCSRNRGQALLDAMLAERELPDAPAACDASPVLATMLAVNDGVMRSRPGLLTAKGLGVGVPSTEELAQSLLPFVPKRGARVPPMCAQYNEEGLPDCRR